MKKIILSFLSLMCTLSAFSQQSPLLEKYREMALKYNHDLKAAEKNIMASIELEKSARSDRKPKLSGGASFQYTGNPTELALNIPGTGGSQTFEGQHMQYGTSISLLQPVYTGGRVLEAIRLAGYQQSLSTSQAEAISTAVCHQTDIQYWNTVARQEVVGVITDFRNSISSLVQTIKERVEVGLANPQDLLMAEVKLNEAEFQLLQARNNFETGRMALNSIIGVELGMPTEIEPDIPMVIVQDSLLKAGGQNRPEIKIARDQIQIAGSALKLNDSQYKPQLYIGVDGSYSSPGYNFHKDLDPNYAAYAKLSVPVFEWGKRRSDKRASLQQVGIANDNLGKIEDHVALEVRTARLSLVQAMEQVQLTESSLGKALENESKAIERYSEGNISILEVIDAQTYRQTSQLNYVQAKVTAQSQYSDLLKALNAYDSL